MEKKVFKNFVITISGVALLSLGVLLNKPQDVQAQGLQFKYTVVRDTKIYDRHGRFTGKYLKAGSVEDYLGTYHYTNSKAKLYKLPNNDYIYVTNARLASSVKRTVHLDGNVTATTESDEINFNGYQLKKVSSKPSTTSQRSASKSLSRIMGKNKITMPSRYKVGINMKAWKAQSKQGNHLNKYHSIAKDRKRKINLDHLTPSQQAEINAFANQLYSEIRQQCGMNTVANTSKTITLANRIANNYRKANWNLYDNGHYVKGIVQAAKSMGLNINDNYIEDAYTETTKITNMNELKRFVYDGTIGYIFADDEQDHAKSVMNPQNVQFGVSFNTNRYKGMLYTNYHFIVVSSVFNW